MGIYQSFHILSGSKLYLESYFIAIRRNNKATRKLLGKYNKEIQGGLNGWQKNVKYAGKPEDLEYNQLNTIETNTYANYFAISVIYLYNEQRENCTKSECRTSLIQKKLNNPTEELAQRRNRTSN